MGVGSPKAAGKRYKKVANATAVIWKMLLITAQRFRRLNTLDLLLEVAEGARYVDGVGVKQESEGEEGDRLISFTCLLTKSQHMRSTARCGINSFPIGFF